MFIGLWKSFKWIKKEEKEQDSYELTPINAENLQENMFYVKNGDDFYPIHMGETNVNEENLIAKEANPDRIVSFTKDDSLIPTMYKDDTMIYYTKQSVPGFTWERFSDKGYTIGLYNLKVAESWENSVCNWRIKNRSWFRFLCWLITVGTWRFCDYH